MSSVISSSSVKSSNHCSTLAALFVPSPRSISAAPSVNAPRGISIRPAPIPANILWIVPTLLVGPPPMVPVPLPPPIVPVALGVEPPICIPTRPPSLKPNFCADKTVSPNSFGISAR